MRKKEKLIIIIIMLISYYYCYCLLGGKEWNVNALHDYMYHPHLMECHHIFKLKLHYRSPAHFSPTPAYPLTPDSLLHDIAPLKATSMEPSPLI